MPRPRKDGTPAKAADRRALTERLVRALRPRAIAYCVWDTKLRGLAVRVLPTGRKTYKYVYTHRWRPCWYHIGECDLGSARRVAARLQAEVAMGGDPCAARKEERGADTFAAVAARYVREHSSKKNKSWKQADYLIRRYVLPKLGRFPAKGVTRAQVREVLGGIERPILQNAVHAACSAVFRWAMTQDVVGFNPCSGITGNKAQSRERVLSDEEIASFWRELGAAGARGAALLTILLTGVRPSESRFMRLEHIGGDGWWDLPGAGDENWPGTKSGASRRVWLAEPVRSVIGAENRDRRGYVFASSTGRAVDHLDALMAQISRHLNVPPARPHDLRRSFGTLAVKLFDRPTMSRLLGHADRDRVGATYDRFSYAELNKKAWEAVARHVVDLAEGRRDTGTVVRGRF